MGYCTESDVRRSAPAGLFTNQSRVVGLSASTGRFELDGHGYEVGQAVRFRSDSALPSPLSEGVDYYVTSVDEFSFTVSAASGGANLQFVLTADASMLVYSQLPFADWIDWASAMVDSFLPAHVLPLLSPYHELIVSVTAQLAAARALQFVGGAQQDILALQTATQQILSKWGKNQPIRGANAPRIAAVSCMNPPTADSRGWSTNGRIP